MHENIKGISSLAGQERWGVKCTSPYEPYQATCLQIRGYLAWQSTLSLCWKRQGYFPCVISINTGGSYHPWYVNFRSFHYKSLHTVGAFLKGKSRETYCKTVFCTTLFVSVSICIILILIIIIWLVLLLLLILIAIITMMIIIIISNALFI